MNSLNGLTAATSWTRQRYGGDTAIRSQDKIHRGKTMGSEPFGSLPIVLPRWILSWLRIAVSPPYRWRVHDVAAALLMNRFYENLMRAPAEGLPIAKALDEAREWLRSASRPEIREASKAFQDSSSSRERSGGESSQSTRVDSAQLTPYADPYYWAGFVVIGAPL